MSAKKFLKEKKRESLRKQEARTKPGLKNKLF